MRKRITATSLAAGALLAWTVIPALAADSVTGEVVDLTCYLPHPQSGQGAGHKKCADVCLKKGLPAGLLTADQQLYLLLEDHDNSKPYATLQAKAAEPVTGEGQQVTQHGMQGIVVQAVK